MDKTSYLYNKDNAKIRFLGTTLWSYIPPNHEQEVGRCLNDYHVIRIKDQQKGLRHLQVSDTLQFFNEEVAFLEKEIGKALENKENVCILTHHAPLTLGTSHPKYNGSTINCAFSSNLERLMGKNVHVWCYGHTHYSSFQICKGTRVLSNQTGYFNELLNTESNFNLNQVIEIPNTFALVNEKITKQVITDGKGKPLPVDVNKLE